MLVVLIMIKNLLFKLVSPEMSTETRLLSAICSSRHAPQTTRSHCLDSIMEQMDRIMHRMEVLLVEAQDAILDYDSKTLVNSNDSLDALIYCEKKPIDILKDCAYIGFELQLAFFYLMFATLLYLIVNFCQIFFNVFNMCCFWPFRKRQINTFK